MVEETYEPDLKDLKISISTGKRGSREPWSETAKRTDAAGGCRRSLRAERGAVRGGPGKDRARHEPARAGSLRCGRRRGRRGAGVSARAVGRRGGHAGAA